MPADSHAAGRAGHLDATGGLGGSRRLSWGAATDNVGVAKYDVYRSTTSGFTPTVANRIAQPTGLTYNDTGLAAGTYYYRVAAEDAAGNHRRRRPTKPPRSSPPTPPRRTVDLTAPGRRAPCPAR